MPADLDPLAWNPSTRNLAQTILVLAHLLCLVVSVFLLDRLLPHLEKPGMSARKAIDCVGLGAFLLIATSIAAWGVYVGGRLLYGYLFSLPGAPRLSRGGFGAVLGHAILCVAVYYTAWSPLRSARLIDELEQASERTTRSRHGRD